MTSEQRATTADGRTFVYLGQGEGPLVVLQHGFPDTPMSWEPVQAALAERGYRTVAPWLRGYHPDTWVEGRPVDAPSMGADLVDLLDLLADENERAVVVGHDWGAVGAYAAASQAPWRLAGIVPVAIPHVRAATWSVGALNMIRHFVLFNTPLGPWWARRDGLAYLDTLYRRWSPSWTGPERDRVLETAKRVLADPQTLDRALAYYRAFSIKTPAALLDRTVVPGLVFAGDEDWGGDPRPFRRTPQAFEAPCDVVIAARAGHWAHLEARTLFVAEVREFLGRVLPTG